MQIQTTCCIFVSLSLSPFIKHKHLNVLKLLVPPTYIILHLLWQFFSDLLTQPAFRKGFVIDFYPGTVTKDGKIAGGYRPEEHLCKEQEQFQRDYLTHVRKNMKFKYNADEKAQRSLLGMARKIKINPQKVNFIGVHVRRTDHVDFMLKQHDMEPIEDDYYDDAIGMKYIGLKKTGPILF